MQFSLRFTQDWAQVRTDPSYNSNLISKIAMATGVTASRWSVQSVLAGSVIVTMQVTAALPGDSSASVSAVAAVNLVAAQVANPSSALVALLPAIDSTFVPTPSVVQLCADGTYATKCAPVPAAQQDSTFPVGALAAGAAALVVLGIVGFLLKRFWWDVQARHQKAAAAVANAMADVSSAPTAAPAAVELSVVPSDGVAIQVDMTALPDVVPINQPVPPPVYVLVPPTTTLTDTSGTAVQWMAVPAHMALPVNPLFQVSLPVVESTLHDVPPTIANSSALSNHASSTLTTADGTSVLVPMMLAVNPLFQATPSPAADSSMDHLPSTITTPPALPSISEAPPALHLTASQKLTAALEAAKAKRALQAPAATVAVSVDPLPQTLHSAAPLVPGLATPDGSTAPEPLQPATMASPTTGSTALQRLKARMQSKGTTSKQSIAVPSSATSESTSTVPAAETVAAPQTPISAVDDSAAAAGPQAVDALDAVQSSPSALDSSADESTVAPPAAATERADIASAGQVLTPAKRALMKARLQARAQSLTSADGGSNPAVASNAANPSTSASAAYHRSSKSAPPKK